MSLINTITSAIVENPIVSLAAVAGVRIIAKDIGNAKRYIEANVKTGWDGIERRGPNRAKNVVRPQFGVSRLPAETVEVRRTGTEG